MVRWKRGCQSLNSSLLSYSYPYEKPLITVNHVVSMVTSTDFGLLYYHILSLHQHYNMNIRILYKSLVGFPSVKTWQPTKNMGWECSISTKSSPGPSFNASSNAQALVGMAPGFKSCGDSASRRTGNQHVWGCFPSNYSRQHQCNLGLSRRID